MEVLPDEWKGEPIVILNDSVFITVSTVNDENRILYSTISYIFVNKRNPTLLERMVFSEDMSFESTPVIEVTALYPDGSQWKSRLSDFTTEPYLYSGQYKTNHLIHTFTFPRYVKGMLIRLSVNKEFVAPTHYSHEPIRDRYPILQKTVCFTYPKGYTINQRES